MSRYGTCKSAIIITPLLIDIIPTMNQRLILPILLLLLSLTQSISRPRGFPWSQAPAPAPTNQQVSYMQLYYTQKVSHFNFKYASKTWQQRYLIDLTSWSKSRKGPILMYCGNEGPIQMFYRNTGWYNDYVTKQLNGLLLYPEHRYFGKSWPFGDQKTSTSKDNLVYLTTEQAMMDFVEFIKFIKKSYCTDCPVVVFGGSYGGMLATWMRMKYPNVVDIAHAASAPIYYYGNRQNFNIGIFYQIVTQNYAKHNQNCPNVIRQAFRRLLNYSGSSQAPIANLSKWFNTCSPIKTYQDIDLLIEYINTAYSYMAMINYPYPTFFLKNVTAWPANSSCIPLDSVSVTSPDSALFSALTQSISYYYSYNKTACNDIYTDDSSDEDMSGWNILACGDQAMPMNTNGVKDMFWPADFDYDAYTSECYDAFGIKPDYQYTLNHFGGVTDKEYLAASNIIFTNGGLDPWSGASPTTNLSDTLVSCFIPNGAHHLDLRPPNAADPQDVKVCRAFVLNTIKNWLNVIKDEKKSSNIRSE